MTAITGQLATKADLTEAALRIETRMNKVEGDIPLLKETLKNRSW